MISPAHAITFATSFETEPPGDFSIGVSPITATFTGGNAQTVGDFSLYRTGTHSWHVGRNITAVISFETPANDIELFFRDIPGGGPSEVRVIDVNEAVLLTVSGSQQFQRVAVENIPDGQPLIDRIEVQNSGFVDLVVDDFRFTAEEKIVVESTGDGIGGLSDISGDGVADIAQLLFKGGSDFTGPPRVRYFSGANGKKIKSVGYLSNKWTGIALATSTDGNRDGVADDPAVAILADKIGDGSHKAEIRFADTGAKIKTISFLSRSWDVIDIAVLDDADGDGVSNDPAIAVLAFNPDKPHKKQIIVQLRRITDGTTLKNIFFLTSNWDPIALEAVNRPGENPLLSVLAKHKTTGENMVQSRLLTDGSRFRNTTFHTMDWQAQDLALLRDTNGNGNPNDPSYLVLATNPSTDENMIQAKKVSNAVLKKTMSFPSANWLGLKIMSSEDLSGNLREEVGVLAEHRSNGSAKIQLKDYNNKTTTLTIFP